VADRPPRLPSEREIAGRLGRIVLIVLAVALLALAFLLTSYHH